MLLELSIAVCVALAALAAWRVLLQPRLSALNALPGPPYHWLLGNMRELVREPTVAPHWRWYEALGRPPLLHYHVLFARSSVLVLDAELAREVLITKRAAYPKNYWQLKAVIGDGLVTLEGDAWKHHRHIIQPAFSSGTLKLLANSIVVPCTRTLAGLWRTLVESGAPFKVHEHLSALTLDVIGRAAFDHHFHAVREMRDPDRTQQDNIKKLFFENLRSQVTFTSLIFGSYFRYLRFLPGLRERYEATKRLDAAVGAIVAAKRQRDEQDRAAGARAAVSGDDSDEEVDGSADDVVRQRNFLTLLFAARGEDGTGLAPDALRDEVKTFLMAGHETTSTLCTWVFLALAKHEHVCNRIVEEIEAVCGADRERDITTRDVARLEYLDAVIKEVLRLYPPVPLIVRSSSGEDMLGGQHRIPHGTRVVVPMVMLHRMEKYWGPTAAEFDPQRWLAKELPYSNSCAYMPFLVGARNCIGKQFALLEAKIILATLLRSFRVRLAPHHRDTDFTLTTFITMMPKPFPEFVVEERPLQ